MVYEFLSIDEFLFSFEKDLMDNLYNYGLLEKFSLDARKVFLYLFITKVNEKLKNKSLLFYHNHELAASHELLQYYPADKFNPFINKICVNIKKATNRLFFIPKRFHVPKKACESELSGEVIDEIILLKNEDVPFKELRDFLHTHHLKELFDSFSKNVN